MHNNETREAYARGVTDGRRRARASREAVAPIAWDNLAPTDSAYARGIARGIRDVRRGDTSRTMF